MAKTHSALLISIPLILIACGGINAFGTFTTPAATGSIQYSSVTGTAPFANGFSPSNGSLTTGSGLSLTKDAELQKFIKTNVSNLQDLKFHLDDSTAVGDSYTLSIGGPNRLVFQDRSSESTVWDAFAATSGTIHLDSVNGSTYTFTLTNVVLDNSITPGTGFTMNGTVTVELTFGS